MGAFFRLVNYRNRAVLNRFPKYIGRLAEVLADPLLKHLTTRDLAEFFDVSERTIRRWKSTETPRHVLL